MEDLYATIRRKRQGFNQRPKAPRAPTKRELMVSSLEETFGGKSVANAAAAVIQRAWRAHKLQNQFAKIMHLAASSDRLDKRLSLLGPDFHYPNQLQRVERDIDRLIVEAAGMMRQQNQAGPAQRHIRNMKKGDKLKRSASLRMSGQTPMSFDGKSRDDLEVMPPPCPPLRGEVLYTQEPVYVTRDALYAQDEPIGGTMRPRPPQRTVSFLTGNTLPRKVSFLHRQEQQQLLREQTQHARICSDGELHSPKSLACRFKESHQHERSNSSPTTLASDLPLPPPPYVPPPSHGGPGAGAVDRPQDSPDSLPPPPPELMRENAQQPAPLRPPCDSASSSSSVDSGYGRSSVTDSSVPCWSNSNGRSVSDNVFEPRFNHLMKKKSVRILTPEDDQNEANAGKEEEKAPSTALNQPSALVEEDIVRRRQYRVGLNLFNQVMGKKV